MYASFFGIKISTTAGVSDEQLYMNFMMYGILNKVLQLCQEMIYNETNTNTQSISYIIHNTYDT